MDEKSLTNLKSLKYKEKQARMEKQRSDTFISLPLSTDHRLLLRLALHELKVALRQDPIKADSIAVALNRGSVSEINKTIETLITVLQNV